MDQLQKYEFDKIFPGCRLLDIHEYLMERGEARGRDGDALRTTTLPYPDEELRAARRRQRVDGHQGHAERPLAANRARRGHAAGHFHAGPLSQGRGDAQGRGPAARRGFTGDVRILTSCPSCLQGLSRFADDADTQADYIVVEIAKHVLGANWMAKYVASANAGGIERVLV